MEIKLLSCPVCLNPHFNCVDALRTTLVQVATNLVSCPVCSESLLGLDKLTIHLFSHISNSTATKPVEDNLQKEIDTKIYTEVKNIPEEPVKCDICNFSFTDKHILDIHQKLLHQTPLDMKTGTYSYHCHLCSKKFKMRGSLMVHLRVAHYGFIRKESSMEYSENNEKKKEKCIDNDEMTEGTNSEKQTQGKFQDNKQWECDVCSKWFTTKYFLKKHKRLHTGEMPYCCTLCNKSFTFQQSYHKHMLYHSSEKPHICNECGRAFKELSTLQNHARIHSGERPFICETCGKSFRQRVSYLVHRRIHTGVMPYKCNICEKSFRYKVSQKSHKCLTNSTANSEQQSTNPTSQSSSKCIMNVDLNTGDISVVPNEFPTVNLTIRDSSLVQKESILLNNNERIEISYKKTDFCTTLNNSLIDKAQKLSTTESQDDIETLLLYTQLEKSVHSPLISNILPEVESLYLNGSPTSSLQIQTEEETINDIREKCLQELLNGIE